MFISTDEAKIFALSFGPQTAPPILALSGWIGSWEDWAATFSSLSERWRTISYDHRGSGATMAPLHSIHFEQLVNDVFVVMDAYGLEKCVLAAMSMGTAVALAAALHRPERFSGLVIVNGFYYRPPIPAGDPFLAGLHHHYPQTLDQFARSCVPEKDGEAIRHWGRQILDRADPAAAIALYEMTGFIDLRPQLPQLTLPTLILHGDADPLVPMATAQWLAQTLPNAKLVRLPGAGHVPIMTFPTEVTQAINDFFFIE